MATKSNSNANRQTNSLLRFTFALLLSISWAKTGTASTMLADRTLRNNQYIDSSNACFRFIQQSDGNLVLYQLPNRALWSNGMQNRDVLHTIFQTDGNLVTYDRAMRPLWASNSEGRGGVRLVIQNDGNAVIYRRDNVPIWATNTSGSCEQATSSGTSQTYISNRPDFKNPYYTQLNIFWRNGYAPSSTSPPSPKLGNALGNCTWYASGRAKQLSGSHERINRLTGNATRWLEQARAAGFTISGTPRVGSIAYWQQSSSFPYGHVAIVERVNADGTIVVSESSYAPNVSSWNFLYRIRQLSRASAAAYLHP